MIKADLVDAAHARMGLSRQDAAAAVEAILAAIKETLSQGDQVQLVGFGRFKVRHRHARVGRNPKTGQVIHITPHTVVTFRPSRILWNSVNREGGS